MENIDLAANLKQIPSANDGGYQVEVDFAEALISSRQNISPKRLVEPAPRADQMDSIFRAAAAAPDHGMLTPWRFVLVPKHSRDNLAEVFALSLIDRDPGATLEQIESAREKAHRAPCLLMAIARLGNLEPPIPTLERMVSVGAAIQNMLLCAHSMGYGSGLTSGQAMQSPRMRQLFSLTDGEEAVCCVNIGSVSKRKMPRVRPDPLSFVSSLQCWIYYPAANGRKLCHSRQKSFTSLEFL